VKIDSEMTEIGRNVLQAGAYGKDVLSQRSNFTYKTHSNTKHIPNMLKMYRLWIGIGYNC